MNLFIDIYWLMRCFGISISMNSTFEIYHGLLMLNPAQSRSLTVLTVTRSLPMSSGFKSALSKDEGSLFPRRTS
jgi:hypothetical protein